MHPLALWGAALAPLLLSACAQGPSAGGQPSQATAAITGTALYRERIALPPQAVLEATLADVSRADGPERVLGSQRVAPAGSPPYALNIAYDPARLQSAGRYAVRARMTVDGQLWFDSDRPYAVLQHPGDQRVDLVMRRVEPHAPVAGTPLLGTYWRLVELSGKDVPATHERDSEPHLVLQAKGQAGGSDGCNRFNGSYVLDGMQLVFAPLSSTRMACRPGSAAAEGKYLQALQAVQGFKVQQRQLVLTDAAGQPLLRLEAVSAPR